ncbi:MAG: tetratricopeptide repeat protein [Thermodesulfobacteriota bacterium]
MGTAPVIPALVGRVLLCLLLLLAPLFLYSPLYAAEREEGAAEQRQPEALSETPEMEEEPGAPEAVEEATAGGKVEEHHAPIEEVVEGEGGYDTRAARLSIASMAVEGKWHGVVELASVLIEKAPGFSGTFTPVLAYAMHKIGEEASAIEIIEGRDGPFMALLRGSLAGKEVKLSGRADMVKGPDLFFVEVGDGMGSLTLGIFPKVAELMVLKKALYSVDPEVTVADLELFESKVAPDTDRYFLGGTILAQEGGRTFVMAFVDSTRLADELGLRESEENKEIIESKGAISIGLITRHGGDAGRKLLAKELSAEGFLIEDLGRGNFYSLGEGARGAVVVVEIAEGTRVSGKLIKGNFKNIEGELVVAIYKGATGENLLEINERSSVLHINEDTGRKLAIEECYRNVALKLKGTLTTLEQRLILTPAGTPPLGVEVTTGKVFSNNYKYYTHAPMGTVTLTNTTDKPITNVTVRFSIKEYMDFSTQIDVGEVPPKETVEHPLTTVFNNRILDITEDTILLSAVKVSYFSRGKKVDVTVTHPVYVYERHALVWDDKGKVAAFITPKDPVVIDFATQAVIGYRTPRLNKNLSMAKAVFEALGVVGVRYVVDPNNPYRIISDLTDVVDYVQFPRETLARKAGDCDDLSSLYASLLESLGIRTKLLDAPGHLYMIFDTGIPEAESALFGFPEESFIIDENTIWVPVETTLVGSSFSKAWKRGIEEFIAENEETMLVDLREAWKTNTPPTLTPAAFDGKVTREEIEAKFPGETERLEKERDRNITHEISKLGKFGLKELVLLFGREGMLERALDISTKLIKINGDAATFNNLGNIYYLKGKLDSAIKNYRKASELDPEDVGIWVNLARSYLRKGLKKEAGEAFGRALGLDPVVRKRFADIYLELEK